MSEYKVGSVVSHEKFGKGTITEIQQDKGRVVVNFIIYGPKTMAIEKARLRVES